MEAGTSSRPTGGHAPRARLIAIAALAVVALSLFWGAAESHYRSCIAKAQAQFPAVPVSALNGRQTGPLKVSFVEQRAAAVKSCHRL